MKLRDIEQEEREVEVKKCPKCAKGKLYETGTSWSCNRCNYSERK